MVTGSLDTLKKRRFARAYSAIAKYRGAVELGWYDFTTRYRRSFFGALWAPFQLTLWIGSLAFIFHDALGEEFNVYVVYLGLGLYMWEYLSSVLNEGPTHFTSQASLIKNVSVDLSYLTVRKIAFLLFRSLVQLPVPIAVILIFGEVTNPALLFYLIPLPLLLAVFTYAGLVILGVLGAQFRDIPFLMPAVVRFFLFTSPILWRGDAGLRKTISVYNPVSYFLELIRAPVEGRAPSSMAWIVVSAISFGALFVAFWVQSRYRNRLIYSL